MAGLTKTEGGVAYPARCFLDRPEPNKPSTWALRIYEFVDGKYQITRAQLGRAAAALSSKGFRGNQYKSQKGGKSHKQLKQDLLVKYRSVGVPDDSIPSYLLPASHMAHSKGQNGSKLNPPENFFSHYGVKGMKWGIRKDRRKTSGQRLAKKAKGMSEENLRSSVKRMQLEQQYTSLVTKEKKANQTRISKGKDAVGKIMADAGKETVKNTTVKAAAFGIDVGVNQISQTPAGKVLLSYAGKDNN
jgi:hypothetical protein